MVARSELNDLSDSSTMKHFVAGTARELDDANFQLTRLRDLFDIDTATGEDLDDRAREIQPGTLRRFGARKAVGTVVLTRQGTSGTNVIPAGTIVKTPDGILFETTQQVQIDATSPEQIPGNGVGRDSPAAPIIARVAGSSGNRGTGTINKFGTKPAGITEVTNLAATTQGLDRESDIAFRQRIRAFIAALARSTVDTLEFVSVGVLDAASGKQVVFSHVFEDPIDRGNVTLYVDDGAGTAESTVTIATGGETVIASALGGEEFLLLDNKPIKLESAHVIRKNTVVLTEGTDFFINPAKGEIFFTTPLTVGDTIDAGYTHFTGLIAEVQKVVDGDPADRANFPGFRAAGILVRVLSPTVVTLSVDATLTILDGFDRATVIAGAEAAVSEYINNLGISGDVIRNELVERIMGVDGVFDLVLTAPTTNTVVLDAEIARITTATIDID